MHGVCQCEADNTAREQKNVTGLYFCAFLVVTGIFATVTQGHLCTGHSHIDIDQRFSVVACGLARSRVLQDKQDCIDRIKTYVRPAQNREMIVECLDATRDWKEFFYSTAKLELHDHCGPITPHVFKFLRRSDLEVAGPDVRVIPVENKCFPLEMYEHPSDVILLVKSQMFSKELSQPPLLIMPHVLAEAFPKTGPSRIQGRNAMEAKTAGQYPVSYTHLTLPTKRIV